jgi:protein arginine N-methyltransferase 5
VLALLSSHLALVEASEDPSNKFTPPAPIIPPLCPVDTPLTPGDTVSQIIAYSSPWIDLCSSDPLIANISRQVLNIEIAYASFCGVGNIIIPGPKTYGGDSTDNDGLTHYARAIQEALSIGSYIQIAIHIPMYGQDEQRDMTGDLLQFARDHNSSVKAKTSKDVDLYETWDTWNVIRSVCKYNSRLSVGKIPNTAIFPIPTLQHVKPGGL